MLKVIRYEESLHHGLWDDFVLNGSVNGTFLQSKSFLNYHPRERFPDHSLLIREDSGNLCAVLPACEADDSGRKVLFSHKGSTFGGPVIHPKRYNASDTAEILEAIEQYAQGKHFEKLVLKITPDLFAVEKSDLLQYLLWQRGYQNYCELSTYVDFNGYKEKIESNFAQGKRTNVNNCIKAGLSFKKLETADEISAFYEILTENLTKCNAKPVHTREEIDDLYQNRIRDYINFYGVFSDEEMLAGTMLFLFPRTNTVHTQYLAAKQEYNKLSPMTFLYYSILREARALNYGCVSWGISTENQGRELNTQLLWNKEAYGSKHALNRTYFKEFQNG